MVLRIILTVTGILLPAMLHAYTFQWQQRGNEPGFKIDVPSDYVTDTAVKKNGVIILFRKGRSVIEVRSFLTGSEYSHARLVNARAARLSSRYRNLEILYERPSNYRRGVYLAAWKATDNRTQLIEHTAFIKNGRRVLALSCLAPVSQYAESRTAFANAIFSLDFLSGRRDDIDGGEIYTDNSDTADKSLYYYNLPNREYGRKMNLTENNSEAQKEETDKPYNTDVTENNDTEPENNDNNNNQEDTNEDSQPAIDDLLPSIN